VRAALNGRCDFPLVMHMKRSWRTLTAAILLISIPWSASVVAADCLQYGLVNLTGRLVRQIYPGPPDYESVTSGDEPLVIWILQLERGICIVGSDSSYSGAYSEREFQLVLDTDQYARTARYARYRHLLGKVITVTGQLLPGGANYEKRFVVVPDEIDRARTRP
jgi:hypothetical protein